MPKNAESQVVEGRNVACARNEAGIRLYGATADFWGQRQGSIMRNFGAAGGVQMGKRNARQVSFVLGSAGRLF